MGRLPVLMYHGVGWVEDDPFSLFVSPRRFAQQMATLRSLGLRGVSVAELCAAEQAGCATGLVGLTFDDGYRDVVRHAVPVLRRHGFSATVFVVSGLVGGDNVWDPPPRRRLVDASDVRTLVAAGWEIGSHSVSHPRLSELEGSRMAAEVGDCREHLAALAGAAPTSFCYPYGAVDSAVVGAVRDAGYIRAYAVQPVPGLEPGLARPRIGVNERDHPVRFAARLLLRAER